jgi:hypothetical protein
MREGLFSLTGEGRVQPTEHARGPWDPQALHGGAAAALITRAFERTGSDSELTVARMGFEFLKPIPFAELEVRTEIVRNGRRVQELAAELRIGAHSPAGRAGGGASGGELIGRASALRIQAVPGDLPDPDKRRQRPGPELVRELPGPEQGEVITFTLSEEASTSLASTGMEMSWLDDPWSLGPARVWMRLREPLVLGEETTPLALLAATADFGNGVSRELEFDSYLFINADLTIHLWRSPRGEWIGLDTKTVLMDGGVGTAESVLHDIEGPVGRAFQTLVVQPR